MDAPVNTYPALPGYLSEENKRKFTLKAGVLGAVFFIARFVIAFGPMLAVVPGMMLFSVAGCERPAPRIGVYWDGAQREGYAYNG